MYSGMGPSVEEPEDGRENSYQSESPIFEHRKVMITEFDEETESEEQINPTQINAGATAETYMDNDNKSQQVNGDGESNIPTVSETFMQADQHIRMKMSETQEKVQGIKLKSYLLQQRTLNEMHERQNDAESEIDTIRDRGTAERGRIEDEKNAHLNQILEDTSSFASETEKATHIHQQLVKLTVEAERQKTKDAGIADNHAILVQQEILNKHQEIREKEMSQELEMRTKVDTFQIKQREKIVRIEKKEVEEKADDEVQKARMEMEAHLAEEKRKQDELKAWKMPGFGWFKRGSNSVSKSNGTSHKTLTPKQNSESHCQSGE